MTLLLILPGRVFYSEYRDDPIFPAMKEIKLPGYERTRWVSMDFSARALACVDRRSWRNKALGETWHSLDDEPSNILNDRTRRNIEYLVVALLTSSIDDTVSLIGAAGLNVTGSIFQYRALPLPKEQWKVEAANLFNASLARLQVNTRDLARGARASYQGFVKQPGSEAFVKDTYLFNAVGKTNVAATPYLIVLVVGLLILLLAWPCNAEDDVILIEKLLGRYAAPLAFHSFSICQWSIEQGIIFLRKVFQAVQKTISSSIGGAKAGWRFVKKWRKRGNENRPTSS